MPAEGPNPGPARRGRRDPQIAQAIELEAAQPDEDFLSEPGDSSQDEILVLPGDVIAVKVVHEVNILGKDSWITFGMQTRVMDGETEPEVFERVASVVNTRVLDVAEDAYRRIEALQVEHDAQLAAERETSPRPRQARLQPRSTR